MKTHEFNKPLTSKDLMENISGQFGINIDLESYGRETLEDFRNKLRTRVFQKENSSKSNDLLTDESYQKDKAMLQLLNTRIKEMLGEDIKKLKDKLTAIEEAKKGVKAPTYTKKAKGSNDGNLANNYPPYDKVTRGDVIAGATGKDQKGGKTEESIAQVDEYETKGGKYTHKGTYGSSYDGDEDDEPKADIQKKPSKAAKTSAEKKGDRELDKAEKAKSKEWEKKYGKGSVTRHTMKDESIEEAAKCNHTPEGKRCPVHGLKECGTMEAKDKPSSGMSKAEKSAVVKKAKAGGDIGKPGKGFKEVEKAAKKGGAKDPKAVAAAAMWKQQAKKESQEIFRRHVKIVNESLAYLIQENEEDKAKAITAAGDIVNDFTSWMQRVGQYQTKSMIELTDAIRGDFGPAEAEAFKNAVGPALSAALEVLTQQREAISNAVAVLAGEQMPAEPMGAETPSEPDLDSAEPDAMNQPEDEFAAADAAAGGEETAGREMRESTEQRRAKKLAESHSIIARLAK